MQPRIHKVNVFDCMTDQNDQTEPAQKELAAKNLRLVILLALIAAGFYVGFFIMMYLR